MKVSHPLIVSPFLMASPDSDEVTFALYLATFLTIALSLDHHPYRTGAQFGAHLAWSTREQLRLVLHRELSLAVVIPVLEGYRGVPVQWEEITYGSLHVCRSSSISDLPRLNLPVLERLASVCGWLLHTLDQQEYFTPVHSHLFPSSYSLSALRPRERAVLADMVHGYDTKQIAQHLKIGIRAVENYRQRLYASLGVSNAQEAIYIGLCAGLLNEN